MRILVTGANGQLGNEMQVLAKENPQHTYYFTDVQELDICDKQAVWTYMAEKQIELVVNCAAYTAVDKAEDNQELAYKLNCEAPKQLASAAQANGAAMIQFQIVISLRFGQNGDLRAVEFLIVSPGNTGLQLLFRKIREKQLHHLVSRLLIGHFRQFFYGNIQLRNPVRHK